MLRIPSMLILSSILQCQCNPVVVNGRRYDIHEDAEGAENAFPYPHSVLNTRSAQLPYQFNNNNNFQHLNQLNQFPQYNSQLQQLNQQNQFDDAEQGNHQYLAALQQYYAASKRPQTFTASAATHNQVPTQQAAITSPSNYQHPLGVLYSAATDVSQFHFNGNGVNYAF